MAGGRRALWIRTVPGARFVALAASLAAVVGPARPAGAAETDPWFGRDKALHFSVSAALAGGGYGATAALSDDSRWRLPVAATVALTAGVGKELYDLGGHGDPSWRDLTWDVLGTATGLGVAWLFDRLVHAATAGD